MRHDVTVPVLDQFGAHFWALKDVCITWLCTSIFCVPGMLLVHLCCVCHHAACTYNLLLLCLKLRDC